MILRTEGSCEASDPLTLMTDFKCHCPACDVWLRLTEQTRDEPARCPQCKAVLGGGQSPFGRGRLDLSDRVSPPHDSVSVEVEERAARLSLQLTELTSELQDRIEG